MTTPIQMFLDQASIGLTEGPALDTLNRARRQIELGRYRMAARYLSRTLTLLHTQDRLEPVAMAYALTVIHTKEKS